MKDQGKYFQFKVGINQKESVEKGVNSNCIVTP